LGFGKGAKKEYIINIDGPVKIFFAGSFKF
jgi:hypothetical protein